MTTLASRLRRLEERLTPAFRAAAVFDPSARDRLRDALAGASFIAGPVESLAELWARAMGISCLDLRVMPERRAAGLPAG